MRQSPSSARKHCSITTRPGEGDKQQISAITLGRMCYIGGRDSQSFHHPRAALLQRRGSLGLFICRCAAELISRLRREISSALPGRENFAAALRENFFLLRKNSEARNPFRIAGFINPGSYLLSRDLSSDYHRRADVSLPGSEWDRVGPSGYDHQALALLSYGFSLLRTS